jgi:hypothetical protein
MEIELVSKWLIGRTADAKPQRSLDNIFNNYSLANSTVRWVSGLSAVRRMLNHNVL